jgi:hydrogenase-4 component B
MALAEFTVSALATTITLLFAAGGAAGLLLGQFHKRTGTRLALACALSGGLLAAYGAAGFWRHPMQQGEILFTLEFAIPGGFPLLSLDLFIDRLAAFFLVLTGLLSALVALYSFVWLEDKEEQHHIAGIYSLFVLFALSVVIVNDVYWFLLFLECLTLAFSYLTLYRHNTLLQDEVVGREKMEDAKRAFKVYLIFSHVGVIFVTAALILLALLAHGLSFDTLRKMQGGVDSGFADTIFLLTLVGLGIKGGVAPAHTWVSIVHPKSPTTTHALTLGLIIKVSSFYMLIRVLFEFLPRAPWWWGWLLLLLAGLTALVGVFYAIVSRDLKTALSNHSVENIGIILAGIGLSLLLSTDRSRSLLAGLAMVAGLYHLLNHAIFKGLLYLCTGAIENRTGTVDMEQLGGLLSRFPWTSATFLVGAVSIAGFPPFNGFVSEWLTLQAIFAGLVSYANVGSLFIVVGGIFAALLMLGTAFGLTALAFVKIVGETLLGAPRRQQVLDDEKKGDVPNLMRIPLVILALFCLLLGLVPGIVVNQLAQIAGDMLKLNQSLDFGSASSALALNLDTAGGGFYTAGLSMLPLFLLGAVPFGLAILVGARRRRTSDPPWTCGTPYTPEAMQITGGAFAFLTWEWAGEKRAFAPTKSDRIPWLFPLTETRYVREYFRRIIGVATDRLILVSERLGNWFQGGDIRQYLAYIFAVFILTLILSVIGRGK